MFFGTPAIAVPALRALGQVADVVGVVCQPDRAAGRGLTLTAPAVKTEALALGLEVLQPQKLRDGSFAALVRERHVDFALVMAYGRILPRELLGAPRLGCLNLHASLLPEYRGAAPIARCLMDGREETGLCLMQMDEGLDTGDVLCERRLSIGQDENAGELSERLAALAAEMVRLDLPRFMAGELEPTQQDHHRATHAPPLTAADQLLDWSQPATALKNRIRALAPRPGATTFVQRTGAPVRRLRILESATRTEPSAPRAALGAVLVQGQRIFVQTGSGLLEILSAQVEGRKALAAAQLAQGRSLASGDRLVESAT